MGTWNIMESSLNTVIVGGGPAGVATSYFLQHNQITHLILEKERAFSEWYKRWDSFHMNTANWMNSLPGSTHEFACGASRDRLGTKADALNYFESHLATINPPLHEFTEVTSIKQSRHGNWHMVTPDSTYVTENVVICTGTLREPKVPFVAAQLPRTISQLHSSEYRNPSQIRSEHVLVVGSGNSGIQICEDLASSGRFDKITLAVSGNQTIPLSIMGISIYTLLKWSHLLDLKHNSWLGNKLIQGNKSDPTTPPSPKQLADTYGVDLVGKVIGHEEAFVQCSDGRTVSTEELSIVWCTGFQARYDFIDVHQKDSVFDIAGNPVHERGIVIAAPGLYFVSLRFQYSISSQSIYGMVKDAQYVAQHIATNRSRM